MNQALGYPSLIGPDKYHQMFDTNAFVGPFQFAFILNNEI